MWLVVGLGNPGPRYALTRHNVGMLALDQYLMDAGVKSEIPFKKEFKSLSFKFKLDSHEVLFIKPQTFMNLSGDAVREACDFYKIKTEEIIVLHDEIDLPFASMKLSRNRGPGGHNGIKDISEKMSTQDFTRIRIGVGKPPIGSPIEVGDFVLQNFSPDEKNKLPKYMAVVGDALESLILNGYDKSASLFSKSIDSL